MLGLKEFCLPFFFCNGYGAQSAQSIRSRPRVGILLECPCVIV